MFPTITSEDVLTAYKSLRQSVNQTPLMYDPYLSDKYKASIYLKREDLQIVRSFKLRGALYAINQLSDDELAKGVICASAGNHAQGVAYTCQLKKVNGIIFMPTTTPRQKIDQVQYFGGKYVKVVIQEDTFDKSNVAAHVYAEKHNLTFIEPFDDLNVILGQGTIGVEIHQDLVANGDQADYILLPVGGGGLISGVSAYVKDAMPTSAIIGVEPDGAASMKLAIEQGGPVALEKVDKFCDGTAVAKVGDLTYHYTKEFVEDFITVPEGLVSQMILDLYTRQAIVVEPSGALTVAALDKMADEIRGKTVVCLISGGNNDINRMAEIEERAMVYRGLQKYFIVKFPQRAGALKDFVTDVLNKDDDITRFEYTKRINRSQAPVFIGIQLGKRENLESLLRRIEAFDSNYINVTENPSLYQLLV